MNFDIAKHHPHSLTGEHVTKARFLALLATFPGFVSSWNEKNNNKEHVWCSKRAVQHDVLLSLS